MPDTQNKWIDKEILIESEGDFAYPDGIFKMKKEEFNKTKQYIDSIVIIEGIDHKEPRSLQDVVGKVNNLDLVEIEGKPWLKGMGHFNDEKISPKFKHHLDHNLPISGSVANWVEIRNGTQVDMLPTHFLMSPDLEPNIPGAGTKNNIMIFNVRRLANMQSNPELDKLKENNTKLEAELTVLRKAEEARVNAKRADLIKKLVAEAKYKEEELAGKLVPELESMVSVFERVSAAPNTKTKNRAVGHGSETQSYTLNAAGQPTTFFSEYERLKAENKLGSRVKAGV